MNTFGKITATAAAALACNVAALLPNLTAALLTHCGDEISRPLEAVFQVSTLPSLVQTILDKNVFQNIFGNKTIEYIACAAISWVMAEQCINTDFNNGDMNDAGHFALTNSMIQNYIRNNPRFSICCKISAVVQGVLFKAIWTTDADESPEISAEDVSPISDSTN